MSTPRMPTTDDALAPVEPGSATDYVRLTALACSGSVAVLALLGMVGGLTGVRLVDSTLRVHVPMAPSTAVLFLALSGVQLLRSVAGAPLLGRRACAMLHLAVAAAALLNLVDGLNLFGVGILDMFFGLVNQISDVPHVDMSPATAALFLLCCASSWPLSRRRAIAAAGQTAGMPGLLGMAGVFGALVALGGSVFFLGYVFGAPLLYTAGVVPVAQSTALGFLLLGVALVCEAGLDLQPLRMFAGPSTKALLLRAFVPLVVGLSLAHSLVVGLGGPHFGRANALLVAGMAVGDALLVGLVVLLVARRVGAGLERAEALRSAAEQAIRAALEEKSVLLREIHHRVKNNMQLISSLFTLHAEQVADPRDRLIFEESRERINSMAIVHEAMYTPADLSRVDMGRSVPSLVDNVLDSAGLTVRRVYELQEVCLPITQSVPCGMLLNELVMNARRHALPLAAQPMLRVALRREGAEVLLEVEDNGPGLPEGFRPGGGRTLGMLLAVSLAEQLHGRLTAANTGQGACFSLRFPAQEAQSGESAALA